MILGLGLFYTAKNVPKTAGVKIVYGISRASLNDDRLGRALDAIYPHMEEIQALIAL